MLNVGIIGFGFMGRMHYKCWSQRSDVKITAICDANTNLVEDTKKAVGNIEGAADDIDFDSLKIYTDPDAMLEDQDLDAVSITLPTHLHPDFTSRILKSGVHVLCEKPMALTETSCREMIKAAGDAGKILQIGHCVRFWPEYAVSKQIIDSGKYGRVLAGSFRRLSAPPTWAADGWLSDSARSGGVALDLHIHDSDYVQYILGMPRGVKSQIANSLSGHTLHIATQYCYENDIAVIAEGGWAMTPSFGFEMSFNIMLEKATIVYDCTRDPAFKVCPAEGDAFTPDVPDGDGYSREIDYFVNSINGKQTEEVLTLEESMNSVKLVLAEIESAKLRKFIEL